MGQSRDQMVAKETYFTFYFDQLGLRYRP